MKEKEIMEIALRRLDMVITEMNVTSSTITTMGYAAVAHDLVKIIALAGELNMENEKA